MTRDERLIRCERQVTQLQRVLSQVGAQLAEQHLRIRFVMDWFKFEESGRGGVVDAAGRPLTAPIKMSLYEIYQTGGRLQMIARMEAELMATTHARSAADQQDLTTFEQAVSDASTPHDDQTESPIEGRDQNGEPDTDEPPAETASAPPERRAVRADLAKTPVH